MVSFLLLPILLVTAVAAQNAPTANWLAQVSPIITPAERKEYLSLPLADRARFEDNFWTGRPITAGEYFSRLSYIDTTFGSGRLGSGANTDQGRVYLSLGPPTKITRLPSSRIFVPIDIWYYDSVPELELNTELRLIFYQKNNIGFPRLYSPTLDTIRGLLLPQASILGMFGPNDDIAESSIRQQLNPSPAEDDVVTASVNVATGIKHSGNDEILGRVTSPATLLGKSQRTEVRSRLILFHPPLDVVQTRSVYGGAQVDLRFEVSVAHELDIQVFEGVTPVYENHLHLNFSNPESVHYTHRLDLLPGVYRVLLTADRRTSAQEIQVPERASISEIMRADSSPLSANRHTPFEFDGRQFDLNPDGKLAFVSVPQSGKLTWIIRRGAAVVSRSVVDANGLAVLDLASANLPPGAYRIEAITDSDSRTAPLVVKTDSQREESGTSLSFNANLAPGLRYAFVGHQWLLRGKIDEARRSLQASIESGVTIDAEVELARADALAGQFDASRTRLRKILAIQPDDFQALSVYAFVEARLQDYPVAAQLYQRALAIQDSPALRLALEKLPAQ
jgi:GWxTD domain-containing protein